MESPRNTTVGPDLAYHYETYNSFVRYSTIFVVHVVVILALLAYFLA
jgi:hypothetical protein